MYTMLTSKAARTMFRDILIHYDIRLQGSILTASLAEALLNPSDGIKEVAACWWIASKFEDVNPLDIEMLILRFFKVTPTKMEMIMIEATVLTRIGYIIPYKTTVRDMYNLVEEHEVVALSNYCYALVDGGLLTRHPDTTAQGWIDAMRTRDVDVTAELHASCDPILSARLIDAAREVGSTGGQGKRTKAFTPENVIDLTLGSPRSPPAHSKRVKVVIDLCTPMSQ